MNRFYLSPNKTHHLVGVFCKRAFMRLPNLQGKYILMIEFPAELLRSNFISVLIVNWMDFRIWFNLISLDSFHLSHQKYEPNRKVFSDFVIVQRFL